MKYEEVGQNNKYEVLSVFNLNIEGRLFVSKPNLRKYFPNIMQLLKLCVRIDPEVKCTKFDLPLCNLAPSIITEISYDSRRDAGYRLLHRCVRHMTDTGYIPKRISDVHLVKITHNDKTHTCLKFSCDVPASHESQCYRSKIIISCDGESISIQCACKDGGKKDSENKEEENIDEEEIMVCVHMFPTLMKLSLLLYDYLADVICFELESLVRQHGSTLACNTVEINTIRESLITLISVALISRKLNVPNDLKDKNINEIGNSYFNMGTEKGHK